MHKECNEMWLGINTDSKLAVSMHMGTYARIRKPAQFEINTLHVIHYNTDICLVKGYVSNQRHNKTISIAQNCSLLFLNHFLNVPSFTLPS